MPSSSPVLLRFVFADASDSLPLMASVGSIVCRDAACGGDSGPCSSPSWSVSNILAGRYSGEHVNAEHHKISIKHNVPCVFTWRGSTPKRTCFEGCVTANADNEAHFRDPKLLEGDDSKRKWVSCQCLWELWIYVPSATICCATREERHACSWFKGIASEGLLTTTREGRISVGHSRQWNLSLNTFLRGLCLCSVSLCGFASMLLKLLLVLNRVYLLMFRAGHSAESESE